MKLDINLSVKCLFANNEISENKNNIESKYLPLLQGHHWHYYRPVVPGLSLGCVKTKFDGEEGVGAYRLFFLIHQASESVIIIDHLKVKQNEHDVTSHFSHLQKKLKLINNELKNYAGPETFLNIYEADSDEDEIIEETSQNQIDSGQMIETIKDFYRAKSISKDKIATIFNIFFTLLAQPALIPENDSSKVYLKIIETLSTGNIQCHLTKERKKLRLHIQIGNGNTYTFDTPVSFNIEDLPVLIRKTLHPLANKNCQHEKINIFILKSIDTSPAAIINFCLDGDINITSLMNNIEQLNILVAHCLKYLSKNKIVHTTFKQFLILIFKQGLLNVLSKENLISILELANTYSFIDALSHEISDGSETSTASDEASTLFHSLLKECLPYLQNEHLPLILNTDNDYIQAQTVHEILLLIKGLFGYQKFKLVLKWCSQKLTSPAQQELKLILDILIAEYMDSSDARKQGLYELFFKHKNLFDVSSIDLPDMPTLKLEVKSVQPVNIVKPSKLRKVTRSEQKKATTVVVETKLDTNPLLTLHKTRITNSFDSYKNIVFLKHIHDFFIANYKTSEQNSSDWQQTLVDEMIKMRCYQLNNKEPDKVNLFELCAYNGHVSLLKLLGNFLKNLNPNLLHRYSKYALCYAVSNGKLNAIYCLLDDFQYDSNQEIQALSADWNKNAPPLSIFLKNQSFLASLSQENILEIINALIDAGANLNYIDNNGHSYLAYVVISEKYYIFEDLLKRGLDPNHCSSFTTTGEKVSPHDTISGCPFNRSTKKKYLSLLESYGGKPATGPRASIVNNGKGELKTSSNPAFSEYLKLVFTYLKKKRIKPVLEYLRKHPYFINRYLGIKDHKKLKVSIEAPILLHACASEQIDDAIKLLKEFSCDLNCTIYTEGTNIVAKKPNGFTAWFYILTQISQPDQLLQLLDHASINTLYNQPPRSIFDEVVSLFVLIESREVFKVFLESNHCLNPPDNCTNILHAAVSLKAASGITEERFNLILETLPPDSIIQLSKLFNKEGFTPLHLAINAGDEYVVNRLLNAKAPVTKTKDESKTAVQLACKAKSNQKSLVGLLLKQSSIITNTSISDTASATSSSNDSEHDDNDDDAKKSINNKKL